MKRENHFLKSVSDVMHMANSTLNKKPLIEICGQKRILLENHQGIVSYNHNEIQVKVCYGMICISGANLKLSGMSQDKLVINGEILKVQLQGDNCYGIV